LDLIGNRHPIDLVPAGEQKGDQDNGKKDDVHMFSKVKSTFLLEAISKKPLNPISALGHRFKSSKYLSMSAG
jgi:hypothetical protein